MSELWSYASGGVQKGPISLEEIRRLVASGELTGKDLAWRPGMANWAPLETLGELTEAAAGDLPVATAVPAGSRPVVSYQGQTFDNMLCTPRTMDLYRQTHPWVRVVAVFMWIGIGFMLLGGIGVALLSTSMRGGPSFIPVVVYAAFSLIYIAPAIYLTRYGSRLNAMMRVRTPEALEQAVEAQKSFWKFVAISLLVIVGIYIAALIVGVLVVIVHRL